MNEVTWEEAMAWDLDEVLTAEDKIRIEKIDDGTAMGNELVHSIVFLAIMRKAGGHLRLPADFKR